MINDRFKLRLPFQFESFIVNALAAMSGAHLFGLSIKDLVGRMNTFTDFPCGRMELKQLGKYTILNDAHNANPFAFSEALKITRKYHNHFPTLEINENILAIHGILQVATKTRL